jgi:phospholipid-translocating ATPase
MAISQVFDSLKVGFTFSYVAPLVMVLSVTIMKEAFDDYYRYKRDQELNNQKYKRHTIKGRQFIRSADIRVGDIIELKKNDRAPADMVILKSFEEGQTFIRTDQLDGETDWKLRKAPPSTQKAGTIEDVVSFEGHFIVDPPSKAIYEFNGVVVWNDEKGSRDPLGLENTIWTNTVLATNRVLAVVIYTGKETRSQMNTSLPRSKIGLLDLEVNKITKILFAIMLICALIIVLLKGVSVNISFSIITYFRFVVLLCGIIPISLRVNLDLAKSINSSQINEAKIIPETIVRNSTIPEELGRIEYLFSDKTGTLTKNEMVFKKISLEADHFDEENFNDIKMILADECGQADTPMSDLLLSINKNEFNYENPKRIRRNRNKVIRDAISALALCNNVTPIYQNGEREYQSSSPDEIALVTYSERLNIRLVERSDSIIRLLNADDKQEEYDILANFPFSSETKRMGIILRSRKYNQIIFYLKGAENIVENFVKEDYKSYIRENSEYLAISGLRTLVICQKPLEEGFYRRWKKTYDEALVSMDNRKEKVADAIAMIENNMEFLCVTGVEDRLQDEVADTIESLKNAGIKIWMLTGDKVETATCIAVSTGLKKKQQRITYMKETNDTAFIKEELEKVRFHPDNILIIDGHCLDIALNNCEKEFFTAGLVVSIWLFYLGIKCRLLPLFANSKIPYCKGY